MSGAELADTRKQLGGRFISCRHEELKFGPEILGDRLVRQKYQRVPSLRAPILEKQGNS